MNRFTLIRFGLALTLLIFTVGGYSWWQSQMNAVQNDITSITTQITGKEKTLANARDARKNLAALESTGSTMQNYLVSNSDIVSFLGMLEGIGKVVDATVSTMSVAPQLNTQHSMLRISVKVTGSFGAVMRAIGAIENMPYYVVINTVTVDHATSLTKSSKKTDWTALMTLSVGSLAQTASTK